MMNYNFQLPTEEDFHKLFQKVIESALEKLQKKEPASHIQLPDYMTRSETAVKCRMSLPTLNKHTKSGLPSVKIGKLRLYDPVKVKEYFDRKNSQ